MSQYHDLVEKVIEENRTTLLKVDEQQIEQLIEEIRQAKPYSSMPWAGCNYPSVALLCG